MSENLSWISFAQEYNFLLYVCPIVVPGNEDIDAERMEMREKKRRRNFFMIES